MQIVLSNQAVQDFEEMLDFVETHFGQRAAQKLENKTLDLFASLMQWPEAHRLIYPQKNVRKAVIHKRVVMFYKVYHDHQTILITRFKSTYQNYSPEDVS